MPVSKLKNLIILILVLVNILLLCLAIPLGRERQQQQAMAAKQLETLFEKYDIRLDSELLPTTQPLYTLEFSPDANEALPAMTALLGENVLVQEDSTRYLSLYRSDLGRCQLSWGGSLSARLSAKSAKSDLEQAVSDTMDAMGVEAATISTPMRNSAGYYTVTATQQILDVPVFSSSLVFSFRSGVLSRIDGSVFFDTADLFRTDDVLCISGTDALVSFLGSWNQLGGVGSSVVEITQGYLRAETASATVVRLVPGWQISTDTGVYWVNGITSEVSSVF